MPTSSTPRKTLELSPREFVCGAVEAVESDGEWTFRRFLPKQAQAYRDAGNEDFYRKTFATAGVRLAFRTDAESLSFDYRFAYGSSRSFGYFDICVDGAIVAHVGLENDDGGRHRAEAALGPGEKKVEIHFPWSRQAFVSPLSLRGATFATPLRRSRTMLCFGDSITQGYDARHPSLSYVEAVARFLDADPVNKAVGGDVFFPALLRERVPVRLGSKRKKDDEELCALLKSFINSCRETLKKLCNPNLAAALLGILVAAVDCPVPKLADATIRMLGGVTVPLMLVIIGAALPDGCRKLVGDTRDLLWYSLCRLIILPLLAAGIMKLLPLDETLRQTAMVVALMPGSSAGVLIVRSYSGDYEFAGSAIVLSTLFSLGTVPLLLWLLGL